MDTDRSLLSPRLINETQIIEESIEENQIAETLDDNIDSAEEFQIEAKEKKF